MASSDLVERTDRIGGAVGSKVDIQQCRIKGFVSKQFFNGEKVGTAFVKMGAKGMAEGMTGEARIPAELAAVLDKTVGKGIRIIRFFRIAFLWEKPSGRPVTGKPIKGEDVKCPPGEDGEPAGTVFGAADMDAQMLPVNILVAQRTHLTQTKAGRIHEDKHGLFFQIRNRGEVKHSFLLCRYKRKKNIKFPHRELGIVPWFVEDVHGKKPELGNTAVNCAVRKGAVRLEPFDEIPQILPGNVIRLFMQDIIEISQIGTDVSGIRI